MRPEPGARNSNAWRCAQGKVRGREAAGHGVSPAHPSVCCARAAAAVRPSLRARSLPPVRPHGAPQCAVTA
ncbi:protein of unknown function [Paraburkholderia dioscoreae]|uniref:Uncharacterized protein n=1 Tax=Paraburkholderia dioscoreae TaxID=2604047 RepID=A0A5Q4ZPT5_9BURK|nr:protein of unknown function [Paraburkholderia dioscoreae]